MQETAGQLLGPLTPVATSWQTIYDALHVGSSASELHALFEQLDPSETIEIWQAARGGVEVIPVWGEHLHEVADRLELHGLDPTFTSAAAKDSFELTASFAEELGHQAFAAQLRQTGAEIGSQPARSAFFKMLLQIQGGYSRLAAALGCACTVCPFTGVTLTSRHAVPVALDSSKQVCVFYRFKSIETFYIVVSSFSGGKEFLYMPGRNVLLRLHHSEFTWGEPRDMVATFDRLSLEHAEKFATYLESETQRAILVGITDNLGHLIWNDITGFDVFEAEGLLRDVKVGLSYRHQQLNVFWMFKDRHKFERELFAKDASSLMASVLEERLFPFRPSSYRVTEAVAARVLRYAEALASAEQKEAVREARQAGYVIWLNFRRHNKAWLNLLEVMPLAIARLVERYGSVLVFADGMPDCAEQGEELRRLLPKGATLHAGFDLQLCDSIHWTSAIDSYVATIGSGLTIVSWIAARPGIAHAENAHLTQMEFWGEVRPDAPQPLVPKGTEIREAGGGWYCDYEVSEDAMLRLFDQLAVAATPRLTV